MDETVNEPVKDTGTGYAGNVKIADDVVAAIAGMAASKVENVTDMSGGIAGDIAGMLGRKNPTKGVKVQINDKEATVDISIIVDYGARIPDVAWKIQENVKKSVEYMTGLNVTAVNVHVQSINFPKSNLTKDEGVAKASQ